MDDQEFVEYFGAPDPAYLLAKNAAFTDLTVMQTIQNRHFKEATKIELAKMLGANRDIELKNVAKMKERETELVRSETN